MYLCAYDPWIAECVCTPGCGDAANEEINISPLEGVRSELECGGRMWRDRRVQRQKLVRFAQSSRCVSSIVHILRRSDNYVYWTLTTVAAQNFEYKISCILDKPTESLFGYIGVLVGSLLSVLSKVMAHI